MIRIKSPIVFFVVLFLFSFQYNMSACSMYKITAEGKTLVGCNYDTWYTTPSIWFENATNENEYGAMFNGARLIAEDKTAPNSGINEAGLVYARLASYHPIEDNPFHDRKKIKDEYHFLTSLLHKCSTVSDVKKYLEQYDHSIFIESVLIYVDTTGSYLVVEPYALIEGTDDNYVLSNFCPSITDNESARKLTRYRNGEDFLLQHDVTPTLDYSTRLADTMSVCRSRNGDGTLLTSIWDTKEKKVNLYFYHSYDSTVEFDLAHELAKGDHSVSIPSLFPKNKEFERLKSYITPFNTPRLKTGMLFLGILLAGIALIYGIVSMVKFPKRLSSLLLCAITLNILLVIYLAVLVTNKYVYYFDAPFKHHGSTFVSASSYIPFILLLALVPFCIYVVKNIKLRRFATWTNALLASNTVIYIALVICFGYWGLYSVW